MPTLDLSYEESLCQQYKAPIKRRKILSPNEPLPFWLELIEDLMCGAGYSYSRIAYRIDVAPSTIQKIATNPNRKPRPKVLHPLIVLHGKVFEGPYATPKARGYWLEKVSRRSANVIS